MVNRIRELLEARQLSPTQFADSIGVGRPVISHILSERNKPSLEVVQKILDAFPDVSLSWLMKGNGPMLTQEGPTASAVAQAAPPTQAAPVEAAPAPTAPAPVPTPAAAPTHTSQPQPFTGFGTGSANATRPAATPPAPRPLPPKFRPGPKQPVEALPSPSQDAVLPPVVTIAPEVVAPAPADFVAPALLPAQPVGQAASESYGPMSQVTGYPAVATAVPPAPNQPPLPPVAAISTPPAAAPSAPNPAAALSFLGEPGKAIRRIVIFYRDGSFSDYVPEGQ